MNKETANWIAMADYDLASARAMLHTGRYLYVIFMCHLSVEKMLKAHVAEVSGEPPARTHNLIYLLKKSGLALPDTMLEYVGDLGSASVPTRYPEDLSKLVAQYPRALAQEYMERTEEILTWLRSHPNLQP